ncbi:MAG: hypothetical protein GY715_00370 [Planctomycetes bacterium]|nr:hypothetical protein [Planctomycetota bacterium]
MEPAEKPARQTRQDAPLLCHRCGAILTAGCGEFYVVRIEAFCDPTPPEISLDDTIDVAAEIDALIAQMHDRSEREMMDDVHRRLTIHLCRRCYRQWMEDPTGSGAPGS